MIWREEVSQDMKAQRSRQPKQIDNATYWLQYERFCQDWAESWEVDLYEAQGGTDLIDFDGEHALGCTLKNDSEMWFAAQYRMRWQKYQAYGLVKMGRPPELVSINPEAKALAELDYQIWLKEQERLWHLYEKLEGRSDG